MCSCSFTWSDIVQVEGKPKKLKKKKKKRRKAKEAIYIYIYEFGETLWREMRNQIVNKRD